MMEVVVIVEADHTLLTCYFWSIRHYCMDVQWAKLFLSYLVIIFHVYNYYPECAIYVTVGDENIPALLPRMYFFLDRKKLFWL